MHADKFAILTLVEDLEKEFKARLARIRASQPGKPASAAAPPNPPAENPAPPQASPRQGKLSWLLSIKLSTLLALPFIYGMIIPFLILDASATGYQAICFRLFKIQRVKKSDYIALERHNLGYLNPIERINCDYCGYANGLAAYLREILSRTEQYFCPIKHAHKILGVHERYAQFLDYGQAEAYQEKLSSLRAALLP